MATQLLISLYQPDLVLNAGVAGCFEDMPIGSIVLAEGFLQHDVDTSCPGRPCGTGVHGEPGAVPHQRIRTGRQGCHGCRVGVPYRTGWVATGDWFATDTPRAHWIADTFHPLLCEMEGCADAQVCLRNNVPFMSVKSVSDCLFEHHDFVFNFPTAMRDLNRVVMAFVDQLEA